MDGRDLIFSTAEGPWSRAILRYSLASTFLSCTWPPMSEYTGTRLKVELTDGTLLQGTVCSIDQHTSVLHLKEGSFLCPHLYPPIPRSFDQHTRSPTIQKSLFDCLTANCAELPNSRFRVRRSRISVSLNLRLRSRMSHLLQNQCHNSNSNSNNNNSTSSLLSNHRLQGNQSRSNARQNRRLLWILPLLA